MSDDFMYDEFKIEAAEMFEEAEESLLNIDRGEDFMENFNAIFRAFHSLKGAAGMFGLIELQDHMHKLESLFESSKDLGAFTHEQTDYFLRGVDAAKMIMDGESVSFAYANTLDEISKTPKSAEIKSAPEVKVVEEVVEVKTEKIEPVVEIASTNEIEDSNSLISLEEKRQIREKGLLFVVDDEEEIVDIISEILRPDGYVIKGFTNPEVALESIHLNPDIIISDINMPEMSGVELIDKVREQGCDVPIIIVSAFITKEVMLNALANGAYTFIDKPFESAKLRTICKNAFSKHRSLKLLNKSIDYILYQFSDLDEYLKKEGKENVRSVLKTELETILEQRKLLKKLKDVG